ncbi:MAG: alpha/beta hydrolase [Rhizobiaceae bacterium]
MSGMRLAMLALLLIAFAGCASGQLTGTDRPDGAGSGEPAVLTSEHLFVATTRARAESSEELFTGERGAGVDYASVRVTVPPVHKPGELERPRYGAPSPAKHFTITDRNYIDSGEYVARSVDDELATRPPDDREVLLFVHGYNTAFSDSVLRFSQFAYDAGFDGTLVLFTWASRGSAVEYFYDRESATIARDGLERTLRLLAGTNARKIHIMAHSMGNWVAMETLRQLRIAGDATLGGKIGEVVLASPDIDVDVFKAQMLRVGQPEKPYHLLISADDRALNLSQRISGNQPRIGNYTNDADITNLGIIVYDLTKVKSDDRLRHGKFAQAPEIVQLLGNRLNTGSQLASNEVRFSDRLQNLTRNIGEVVVSTGDVVIHTPATLITKPDQLITAPVEVIGGTIKPGDCRDCPEPTDSSNR